MRSPSAYYELSPMTQSHVPPQVKEEEEDGLPDVGGAVVGRADLDGRGTPAPERNPFDDPSEV